MSSPVPHISRPASLSTLDSAIIRTLLYFDIFHYPLTADEIYRFLTVSLRSVDAIRPVLDQLSEQGLINCERDFYFMNGENGKIERRLRGNEHARAMIPRAVQRSGLIASFPFVRAVFASGSLSKGYMDDQSDLDFFIVTARNRVWIARMLLVIYKRIALGNSSKEFCINYFISSDKLEIDEKNLFTATELVTLLPLFGSGVYQSLKDANQWTREHLPNHEMAVAEHLINEGKKPALKTFAESLLNVMGARWIDALFRTITIHRWKKLYQKRYSKTEFDVAFKSTIHVSKNHPKNYQRKITDLLEEKWVRFTGEHQLEQV